jgi:hypothetical protein
MIHEDIIIQPNYGDDEIKKKKRTGLRIMANENLWNIEW